MLFHTLVELFSIVVAFAVFIVAWNSRKMQENKYLHVVGIAYLFIGGLDLLHTLSFKGLNMFEVPGYPANQFWIGTRGMEALIFLGGFFMIGRKRKVNSEFVFLLYFAISLLISSSILIWKIFPVCYIEGEGQTPFKIYGEYLIISILLASLFLLYKKRRNFDRKTYQLLAASIVFAILSESCFASYALNTDTFNELGHYGKLASFFLIYKANVQMAFENPMASIFRELKASEKEYKTLAENLPDVVIRFDENLNCTYTNKDLALHSNFNEMSVEALTGKIRNALLEALSRGVNINGELEVTGINDTFYYSYQIIPENLDTANGTRLLVILRDITFSKKERLHLSRLLDALPHQVWTANADGTIDYVNDVVVKNFALDPHSPFGFPWDHHVHPEDSQQCIQAWQTSLQNGSEYNVQFRLKLADGKYVWHLGRAVPILEEGKVKLWIGSNTDIDSQKRGQELRDEFISIASHELKTPLTSIKAFNQILSRAKDFDKAKTFLKKVDTATIKLEKLINDLLDVSRINAGKLQFNKSWVNAKALIKECCDNIQLGLQTHQIRFEGKDDIEIYADYFRLEQVIDNLLNNAVKYSPNADFVQVTLGLEQDGIIISVADKGIGIANAELEKLFERYYRSDNAAERFNGLGLGLFISSEIIKGHQGTFWIESELGVGTTVYIRLPLTETVASEKPIAENLSFSNENLTIRCNQQKKWMEVNWTGYQNFESVQNGGLMMVDVLKSAGLKNVLNDNREVLGNWSEASDWARNIWFPMMIEAGLHNFAWVFSSNAFSQLAAQKSVETSYGNIHVRFFYDMEEAKAWLSELPIS